MFTGIIDHCGEIETIEAISGGIRLGIRSQFKQFTLGESICVDGICLTVTETQHHIFYCDISPETLMISTAKYFTPKQLVNLEKSLTLSTPLGGHIITGHIDAEIKVKNVIKKDLFLQIDFEVSSKSDSNPESKSDDNYSSCLNYIVKKGSIAINGVSLTVNEVFDHNFSVMLIPHTLEKTNLSTLKPGDCVNAEWDYFAHYVINYLSRLEKKNQ
jgi:riboflavin synthase